MVTNNPTSVVMAALLPIAMFLMILPITQIATGVLCYKLAGKKGYKGYFFTGLFFGMIGLVYVVGLPDLNARKTASLAMKRMVNLHERLSALEEGNPNAQR